MTFSEADTRSKLIDPAINARGWTEDLIRREETAGAIEIISGRARKQAKGRVEYTLRVKVNPDTQSEGYDNGDLDSGRDIFLSRHRGSGS